MSSAARCQLEAAAGGDGRCPRSSCPFWNVATAACAVDGVAAALSSQPALVEHLLELRQALRSVGSGNPPSQSEHRKGAVMHIKELMTTDVATVNTDTPLRVVASILADRRISGVPVVDEEEHVIGVVSEADILFRTRGRDERHDGIVSWLFGEARTAELAKSVARSAGEAMSAPAITIRADRPVAAAARLMLEQRINRLPVVDQDGKLVGIVTRADVVRAFARPDDAIREDIREAVLRRALWVEPDTVEVTVRDGEVELTGELETQSDVVILQRLVEKVPGVVGIVAKVTHREPLPRASRYAGFAR